MAGYKQDEPPAVPVAAAAAVRCGELRCQRNSFARELRAAVVSCRPSTAKGEKGKVWEVRLQDTVLFPEGGGQPCDHGVVGGARVLRVANVDGEAVHFLDAPLETGQEVEVVLDWERRLDLMQQHSAQHLVTALAVEMFGYETNSWDLGREATSLDLGTEELTAEQLEALERRVNAAISEGHPVTPRWIAQDDEEATKIRCRGLPEGITGPLRVLEIEGIDTNLCCGTHVQNTAQLHMVKLLRTERVRDRGETFARLHFVAGDRVLSTLGAAYGRQQQLNALLSVAPEGHVTRVESLLKSEKEATKEAKKLMDEVAELTAEQLRQQAAAGERVLAVHRERGGDMNLLRALASALDGTGALLLTTIGGPGAGTFMLSGPEGPVSKLGPEVASLMKGKGGGNKGRFQGKAEKISARIEAAAFLKEACVAAAAEKV